MDTQNTVGETSIKQKKRHLSDKTRLNLFRLTASFVNGDTFYDAPAPFGDWLLVVFPVACYFFAFLHIGIDKAVLGYITVGKVFLYLLVSLLYSLGFTLLQSGAAFICGMICKNKIDFVKSVRAVGLYHCVPSVIAVIGVLLRLLTGWGSITFGLISILFTLCPFYLFLKSKCDNKYVPAIATAIVGFIQCLLVSIVLVKKFL